jgi:AcrR family transcriptional regulator
VDPPRHPYHHRGDLPKALRAAAREILDETGPEDVQLRKVARRIGVSTTAAYLHFQNKDEFLASIAAEGYRELTVHLEGRRPTGIRWSVRVSPMSNSRCKSAVCSV